jgi:NaMN:DMB phosphoribosyltransferase
MVFAEQMARYAEEGIEEVHEPFGSDPVGFVRDLGTHVIPAVADI